MSSKYICKACGVDYPLGRSRDLAPCKPDIVGVVLVFSVGMLTGGFIMWAFL